MLASRFISHLYNVINYFTFDICKETNFKLSEQTNSKEIHTGIQSIEFVAFFF